MAESKGRKCEFESLGRAIDKLTLSTLDDMKLECGWIIIENCNLELSFITKLVDAVEQLQIYGVVGRKFRMSLKSMSSQDFRIIFSKIQIRLLWNLPND